MSRPPRYLPRPSPCPRLDSPNFPFLSMDLMKEHQEFQKTFCGFCNKRVTSARILQNHMKAHVASGTSFAGESSGQRDFSGHYSLREKPKKTRKSPELNSLEKSLLDYSGMKKNLIRCKECGKGFRYEKCLSNHHIGLHLGNQRVSAESGTTSTSFSLVRRKRSRIIRYKKTRISSFSSFPESLSVFETDQEVEVAECLILLSRSGGNCLDGLKLFDKFLDANPEIPEVEPSRKLGYHNEDSLGCLSNKKMRKASKFDVGFLSNEQKQLGEGIRVDETLKDHLGCLGEMKTSEGSEFDCRLVHDKQNNFGRGKYAGEVELKRMSLGDVSRHMLYDAETEREIDHEEKPQHSEAGFEVAGSVSRIPRRNEAGYEVSGSGITGSNLFKSSGHNVSEEKPVSTTDSATEKPSESERRTEHRCRTCDKVFLSYQALGGHQTLHRMRNKSVCSPKSGKYIETVELEGKNGLMEHKCSVCSRVFKSVHALGGHKKCHRANKSSKARDEQILMKEEDLGVRNEIDLNVPATCGMEL